MTNHKKKKIKLNFLNISEKKYLSKLPLEEQKKIIKNIYKINNINDDNIPFRFKLIKLNTNDNNKAYLFKLYNIFLDLDKSSQEYFKYKIYFDNITNIPFNHFSKINIPNKNINEYLLRSKKNLDDKIYGHTKTKNLILQTITQLFTNPNSIGNIIGLCGPPGIGKTSIIKNISTILQRPLEIINLSGSQDVSFLEGHSFTYEGAKYGKIIETLIKHQTMNPIIFFDEVDKISKTEKGIELENLLINIIDITQNYNFSDKYFQEITIDLSKILFIFSYNNSDNLNPILKDRIFQIDLDDYNHNDKLNIAIQFLIPDILSQFSINPNSINFNKSAISYIINNHCTNETGVRKLKQIIYNIISKIHTIHITNNNNIIDINTNIKYPYTINTKNIKLFI